MLTLRRLFSSISVIFIPFIEEIEPHEERMSAELQRNRPRYWLKPFVVKGIKEQDRKHCICFQMNDSTIELQGDERRREDQSGNENREKTVSSFHEPWFDEQRIRFWSICIAICLYRGGMCQTVETKSMNEAEISEKKEWKAPGIIWRTQSKGLSKGLIFFTNEEIRGEKSTFLMSQVYCFLHWSDSNHFERVILGFLAFPTANPTANE